MQKNVIEIGEIKSARKVGRVGHGKWIWHACEDCGKERWVMLLKGYPKSLTCKSCINRRWLIGRYGKLHGAWKGGRNFNSAGYVNVFLTVDDPFYSMVFCNGMDHKTRYVLEHRLIMAKHLGRCLLPEELVHHLNGIKADNRIENLLLVSDKEHKQLIPGFQKRIRELELELECTVRMREVI